MFKVGRPFEQFISSPVNFYLVGPLVPGDRDTERVEYLDPISDCVAIIKGEIEDIKLAQPWRLLNRVLAGRIC